MQLQMVTQDGRSFPIQGGVNTIGRGLDNQIILDNPAVSRRHAQLRWDATGVFVWDVGSTHGTFIDGQRIPPSQWVALRQGGRLQFGSEVVAQLQVGPPRPSTSVPAYGGGAAGPVVPVYVPPYAAQDMPIAQHSGYEPVGRPSGSGLDLLVRAVDISLAGRKLAVAVCGTALAGLAGFVCFAIASRIQLDSPPIFLAFLLLGIVLVWVAMSFTLGAVAQMSLAELLGQRPTHVKEALAAAVQRWSELLFAPLALVLLAVLVVVAEVVILLVGRVPYIGELIDSLLFIPALIVNLFLAVLLLFGSSLIYPVVVDKGRGVLGTLHFVMVLVRHAPARIVFYLGVSGVLAAVAAFILWGLVAWGLLMTLLALQAGLGAGKLGLMLGQDFLNMIRGTDLMGVFSRGLPGTGFTYLLGGRLIQAGLVATVAIVLSFPLVLTISLACAVYLAVRDEVPPDAGLLR